MALISKSFNLDMTPGVMPQVINVSEYDVNRQLIIFLRHNGGAFTPAAGTTAKIEGTLSNGFGFSEDADLSGNSVSFTLTESMTAVAGRAWVKVKLTNDGAPVSSCGFIMDVDRAGVEADTVIGAPGFEQQIVDAVNDWLDEHPPASGGVTEEFKQALLDCFEHVAWIDDQGQDYYDALYAALYPPADVLSISAVFTQGEAVVYDTDSLDTLKQYLVVTATMTDSTTQTVTDYTLSGTLTVGTSTVTVSYGGKTTTFNVTVTHFSILPDEYQQVEYIANPSNAYIVTTIPVALGNTVHVQSLLSAKPSATVNVCGGTANNQNRAYVSYSTSNNYVGAWVGNTNCFPLVADLYSSVLESWTTVSSNSVYFKGENESAENEKTVSGTTSALTALELFRAGSAGGAFTGRVYFLEVLNGETPTAQLCPCYRIADNKVGMYDIVNEKFYTSENSTAFTKGADV